MRELLLAVFQTGGASVATVLSGMVATKIMAVVLGPAGVGLVSLVRQTYVTGLVLAGLNGQAAIAQGVAAREREAGVSYLFAVRRVFFISGATVAVAFWLLPSWISDVVTGRPNGIDVGVIRGLAVVVLGGLALLYLIGVLNGFRAIGQIAVVQVVGALTGVALAYPVATMIHQGRLLAMLVYLAVPVLAMILVASVYVVRGGLGDVAFGGCGGGAGYAEVVGFLRLAVALLLSGFVSTAVPLAIRGMSVRGFDFRGVGLFDVAWNVSVNYVTLIVASFATYYVPSLSRLREPEARRALVDRVLRLSVFLMVPLTVSIILFKPMVVGLLYSREFLPSVEIMRWMLMADYLRVTSWVFSYTMVAFADVRTLVWTEVAWGCLSIGGAAVAILRFHSLEGIGANFVVVYGSYALMMLLYVLRRGHFVLDYGVAAAWLAGLALIVGVSVHTWFDVEVRPWLPVLYLPLSLGVAWSALAAHERAHVGVVMVSCARWIFRAVRRASAGLGARRRGSAVSGGEARRG